jgi:tetratricopeptide (TPR) repeat protein
MRRRAGWLVVAAALTLGGVASAGTEDVGRAKTYFAAGAQAYSVGQYLAAVQAFDEAYRLAPRSAILFSTAQALRRQYFVDRDRANLDRAIKLYRRYVDEVPQGGRRADAVQGLSELEPLAARLDAESGVAGAREQAAPATRLMISSPTDKARISVDGAIAVAAPYIAEVSPGKHRVKVTASGYFDDEREVVTVKGGLIAFDVRLRERPARLRLTVDDGARIYVDGRYQGEAPLSKALQFQAGKHLVSVIQAGYRGFSTEVLLVRGKTKTVEVELSYSKQRNVSLVLLGAAGVSTVVSLGFFAQSIERQEAAQSVLDRREDGNITSEDLDVYDAARRDRDQLRRAGTVAFATGVTLGAVGGMLYWFDTPQVPEANATVAPPKPKNRSSGPKTLSAAPVVAPGFVGGGFRGTF